MTRVPSGKPCFSGANGRYPILFATIFRSVGEKCALAEKICSSVVDSFGWWSVYSANDGGAAATWWDAGPVRLSSRIWGDLIARPFAGLGFLGRFGLVRLSIGSGFGLVRAV